MSASAPKVYLKKVCPYSLKLRSQRELQPLKGSW